MKKRVEDQSPHRNGARTLASLLLVFVLTQAAAGQEMVPVPKSRLEELERKEAELQKLKADQEKSKGQAAQPKNQTETAPAKAAAEAAAASPARVPSGPPVASLPPLSEGAVVDAGDLVTHYLADAPAADQRYGNRTLRLRGEIERFEKPLFMRDYRIVFKSVDRQVMVICTVFPPETYKAVFTVKNGSELVGQTADERRIPIARVGSTVLVQGRCKGLSDGVVKIAGAALLSSPQKAAVSERSQ